MNQLTKFQQSILPSLVKNEGIRRIERQDISELNRSFFDEKGNMREMPYAELMQYGHDALCNLAHERAIYQFPTTELLNVLRGIIANKSCIEIGAGTGHIGRLLGIKMTDSYQQAKLHMAGLYDILQQPVIQYPKDVERLSYKKAIKQYRPDVVLACWVTHQYDARKHELGGNMEGIDADFIMSRVKEFVFVGNTEVHKNWQQPGFSKHVIMFPDGIVSRANRGRDFIAIFKKL
jgi:hypothetical protein